MTPTPNPILPGAEPYSADGGPDGVLVVHGFTGNPQSMRPLAQALASAGHTVALPLLPGHGTTLDDMQETRWSDWSGAAESAYQELAARCRNVIVAGLSMGGTITCWLAAHHPEIAGIVLVNPAIDPPAESFRLVLQGMLDSGGTTMPGIGSDIADPNERELAYELLPIAPLLSLCQAQAELYPRLGEIRCPVLLLNSPQDHVVPPVSSDVVVAQVTGPVERVNLERSYHVATLDYDRDVIESRSVEFAAKTFANAS
jgi:carboxylesterase